MWRPLRVPEPTASLRAGSGEPLLLIHPFMLSHEVWTDVVPALAQEYDVVAATLPGHWGGPELRRRDVSLDAFADGLEELLDDLGWETAHLAGCSIGGWLSLELARRGRARSVTAIAPAGGWKRHSWTQILVGLKFLMIAPAAFLGRATGDLARTLPFRLLRPLLSIVSARPERMSRAQRQAFVRATTHCSAFLPFFWHELSRAQGGRARARRRPRPPGALREGLAAAAGPSRRPCSRGGCPTARSCRCPVSATSRCTTTRPRVADLIAEHARAARQEARSA